MLGDGNYHMEHNAVTTTETTKAYFNMLTAGTIVYLDVYLDVS